MLSVESTKFRLTSDLFENSMEGLMEQSDPSPHSTHNSCRQQVSSGQ